MPKGKKRKTLKEIFPGETLHQLPELSLKQQRRLNEENRKADAFVSDIERAEEFEKKHPSERRYRKHAA